MTTSLLKEAKVNRSKALSSFETLSEQIENRNELVYILEEELNYLDSIITVREEVVENMQASLDSIQTEYSQMMQKAIREKLQDSRLQFILSGNSLSEYYQRWKFLKEYQNFRTRQIEILSNTKKELEEEVEELKLMKQEKEILVDTEAYQNELLAMDLEIQANSLRSLKKNEQKLRSELKVQEKNKRLLDKNIARIIDRGIAEANRKTRADEKQRSISRSSSANFGNAKGQLSWPVKNGVIVKRFGNQAHPTIRGITISNNGIDIRSKGGAEVRSVFEGEVLQLQEISGYSKILVIGHGQYYTVYSNLTSVMVNKGDHVGLGETIGYLSSDLQNPADLHFEIWKEKQKLNPASWIRR